MKCSRAALSAVFAMTSFTTLAADYPTPKQADWVAREFKFHGGETMPELRLHYTTLGEPGGQPVLVLHGSGGSAANLLTAAFAGELFGPGQPLDAAKYYIIIPDGLAADRDGGAQLDAAADDDRDHPQRSGLQWRQLHRAAADDEVRHQRLSDCNRRRYARLSDAGADGGQGRPDGRRPAGDAGDGRRQRLPLSMAGVARLQSFARAGADRGDAAGDQCCRR